MRRAARVDGNQKGLVGELREIGATVKPTHMVGEGFPDLVVAYRGHNYLVEIKDPSQPPNKRKLTPDEKNFFDGWEGPVFVVETLEHFLQQVERHEK